MAHYLLELAIWLLATFLIGCIIGTLLRRMFGRPAAEAGTGLQAAMTATEDIPVAESEEPLPGHAPMAPRWNSSLEGEASSDEAEPALAAASASAMQPGEPASQPRMPVGISGPRNGRADELQRISGVGPRNEQILHSLGFYHFDQIAQWTEQHVEWVDGYLRFNGRIRRENWVEQCRLLAAGDEEEFYRLYGTGGLRDANGQTVAGDRTRQS